MSDVYALKKRLQVEIMFPVSPFLDVEALHQHWERGVLPWDTYLQHACAAAALPYQAMPEPTRNNKEKDDNENETVVKEEMTEI